MRSCFFVLLLLTSSIACAQSGEGQALIDSFARELSLPAVLKNDSLRADILIEMSYYASETNPVRGIQYGEQGMQLSKAIGSRYRMATASYNIALNHCILSDYPGALRAWIYSMQTFEDLGDSALAANCMTNIGKVHVEQKNFHAAIDYYKKAIAIYNHLGEREGAAWAEGDMGSAYFSRKEYPAALAYYRKALAEFEKSDNRDGIATNTGNIANTLMHMGAYTEALPQFFKTARMYEEAGDMNNYMITIGNTGDCYLRIAKLKTPVSTNDLIPAGRTANLQKATAFLGRSVQLAAGIGNQNSRQSYSRLLSEAEELSGNYVDALAHYKTYATIKDSVFNIENTKKIEDLTTLREKQLKQKDLELHDKRLALARLQRSNERLYFAGGILILLGCAGGVFFNYRARVRNKLLLASIQGEEAERQRIAAELHDDVGATLSSIRLFLTQAEMKPDINLIIQSKTVLDDSIRKIRDLSHQLQPRTLHYLGLARALESLAELISRSGSVRMEFAKKDEYWPDPEAATALSAYRVVQELVTNIVKHAGANWIKLALESVQGRQRIQIAHDGVGLTEAGFQEQLFKKHAIGLKNIENRLKSSRLTLQFPEPKNDIYFITLNLP
jgi:signal transduction histidine kinase